MPMHSSTRVTTLSTDFLRCKAATQSLTPPCLYSRSKLSRRFLGAAESAEWSTLHSERSQSACEDIKLAPAKSGQPARRKRAGKREALRAAHSTSSSSGASQQSSKTRDGVTVAAVGSQPAPGMSTARFPLKSPHRCWVNPDLERQAPGQGRAMAHQK